MKIEEIKQRILATGIPELNPMQEAVCACTAKQIVLLAPTGSGKTLAFAIAMLRSMDVRADAPAPQAVVVAPSRELAQQIYTVLKPLASPPLKVSVLYGGSRFSAEEESIRSAVPHIVIATPGRLTDHLSRGTLDLSRARTLVVDEYDKTLELGFHEQLRRIVRNLKGLKYIVLTSATELAEMPGFIDTRQAETLNFSAVDNPRKRLAVINVPSPARDKLDTLAALLRSGKTGTAIVFVNHRESAERVVSSLKNRGVVATLYHGGMDQRQREISVAKLRAGAASVLVATDLAARGLDIESGVDSVIHYHFPVDEKAWTHRNGRTARAGASGQVYVITGPDENTPDYVVTTHDYYPADVVEPAGDDPVMIYINAGKRQKISRGDIAGFLMKMCGIPADRVGMITVGADYSLAAISPEWLSAVLQASAHGAKIKKQRVLITPV